MNFSLEFVPKAPIDNNSVLIPIMACCHTGAKTLSEPMMVIYWYIYASLSLGELTQWGLNKMAAMLQAYFWHILLKYRIFVVWLKFHWFFSLEFHWNSISIDSGNGMATSGPQAITRTMMTQLTDAYYVSPGLNDTFHKHPRLCNMASQLANHVTFVIRQYKIWHHRNGWHFLSQSDGSVDIIINNRFLN